jgi:hypothetical protein
MSSSNNSYSTIHMGSLVELDIVLKFEQKIGPSLHTPCYMDASSLAHLSVSLHRALEVRRTSGNPPYDDDEDEDEDTVDPVLLDIFKASKMKPLGEEAKKYCRAGHLLECPFLKQFHQHSMEGLTLGYKPIAIHETPAGMSCISFCFVYCFDSI